MTLLALLLFVPSLTSADSLFIQMVNIELTDKTTGDFLRNSEGYRFIQGDVTVRCYGFEWEDLGYGMGFDNSEPDVKPYEVYTLKDYYLGSTRLMDLTSYIKFKTIKYCDFELETEEGYKYISRKYHDSPVDDSNCKFSVDILQGQICEMELEVEKVDKFDWEVDTETNIENDNCDPSSCNVGRKSDINTDDPGIAPPKRITTGFWDSVRCWIVELFGGVCK